MKKLFNLFDKTFFKFTLGFIVIIAVAMLSVVVVSSYGKSSTDRISNVSVKVNK